MKKKTITIAALAVLLLAGTAIAQPGGMGMPNRSMGNQNMAEHASGGGFLQRMRPMLGMLDLTDDQREAIGDIMETARDSMESIRGTEENGSHREDFLNLFSSTTISASEVESLLNDRVDAMKEMNAIIAVALVEIHDVLTADQLAILADFEPGSMEMRNGEHGRGNERNHGMEMGVHPNR